MNYDSNIWLIWLNYIELLLMTRYECLMTMKVLLFETILMLHWNDWIYSGIITEIDLSPTDVTQSYDL